MARVPYMKDSTMSFQSESFWRWSRPPDPRAVRLLDCREAETPSAAARILSNTGQKTALGVVTVLGLVLLSGPIGCDNDKSRPLPRRLPPRRHPDHDPDTEA